MSASPRSRVSSPLTESSVIVNFHGVVMISFAALLLLVGANRQGAGCTAPGRDVDAMLTGSQPHRRAPLRRSPTAGGHLGPLQFKRGPQGILKFTCKALISRSA